MAIIKSFIYQRWSNARKNCFVGLGTDGLLYYQNNFLSTMEVSHENMVKWQSLIENEIILDMKDIVIFAKQFGHLMVWI